MSWSAGRVPVSLLTTVAPGMRLLNPVAKQWRATVLVGQVEERTLRPAGPIGAGYRDWATALDFYNAGRGDQAARKRLHIASNLRVSIAYPPGTHGTADRVDVLFNGRSPDADDVAFMREHDWVQEFGAKDPNHFKSVKARDGNVRAADINRVLGRWLNEWRVGRTTNADKDGKWDSDLIWLVQHYGHVSGTYPKRCREDGITGPNTEQTRKTLWNRLLTSQA